ncbi:hypothetical protein BC833DRAFT_618951 [Globomyces pollinis-pini]|nr:hypothetical protein BC833DRAFT_618951 [Globomyces pollinis-pini]
MTSKKRKSIQDKSIKKKKKLSSKQSYCTSCANLINSKDTFLACNQCQDIFHASCVPNTFKFICSSCKPTSKYPKKNLKALKSKTIKVDISDDELLEDDICVLCDGDCTCNEQSISVVHSGGKSWLDSPESPDSINIESLASMSAADTSEEEEEEETDILPPIFSYKSDTFDPEQLWDVEDTEASNEFQSAEDSSESVYEEPSGNDTDRQSDEDVMVEIVRERLINGWSSEEEEFGEEFIEVFSPTSTVPLSPIKEDETEYLESFETEAKVSEPAIITPSYQNHSLSAKSTRRSSTSSTAPQTKSEAKNKSTAASNGTSSTDVSSNLNSSNVAANSNPWLLLAQMNASVLANYQSPSTIPYKNSAGETPGVNLNAAAASIASNLLKRPVSMNSVATAAAALMANPSALRAFSELRKREMNLSMQSKLKSTSTPPAMGTSNIKAKMDIFSNPNMSKAVEELGRLLQQQAAQAASTNSSGITNTDVSSQNMAEDAMKDYFMDIDSDNEESSGVKAEADTEGIDYSRFRKIPIGTFWNSQRNHRVKASRKNELQKAVKKSSSNQALLQSTLLETLTTKPKSNRKKTFIRDSFLLSPTLVATTTEKPNSQLDELSKDYVSLSIPPPLSL